jgi:hypothetical protein
LIVLNNMSALCIAIPFMDDDRVRRTSKHIGANNIVPTSSVGD